MNEREEKRPVGKTGKKAYRPTRFMLPTSHYDKNRADRAVSFIQSLKHTKGVWAGKPFLLFPWQEQIIRDIFGTIKELSLIHIFQKLCPWARTYRRCRPGIRISRVALPKG